MRKLEYLSRRSYGYITILVTFLLVVSLRAENTVQSISLSDWSNTKKILMKYLREPTKINAWEFFNSIPDNAITNKDKEEALELFDYAGDCGILVRDTLSGDKYAGRAIVRLLPFLEGRAKDILISGLNELIRLNPGLFLRIIYEEYDNIMAKTNGFPITHLENQMRTKERAFYELRMRIIALKSVKDSDLRQIRDRFIKEIEDWIKESGLQEPPCRKKNSKISDNLSVEIMQAIDEALRVPCPENLIRLFNILPDDQNMLADIIETTNPDSIWSKRIHMLFDLLLHEMYCGNEYAADIIFKNYRLFENIPRVVFDALVGKMVIINPGLFVKEIDKFKTYVPPTNFEYLCLPTGAFYYTDRIVEYEKRIEALERLNMPEQKELIDYFISLNKEGIRKVYSSLDDKIISQ